MLNNWQASMTTSSPAFLIGGSLCIRWTSEKGVVLGFSHLGITNWLNELGCTAVLVQPTIHFGQVRLFTRNNWIKCSNETRISFRGSRDAATTCCWLAYSKVQFRIVMDEWESIRSKGWSLCSISIHWNDCEMSCNAIDTTEAASK